MKHTLALDEIKNKEKCFYSIDYNCSNYFNYLNAFCSKFRRLFQIGFYRDQMKNTFDYPVGKGIIYSKIPKLDLRFFRQTTWIALDIFTLFLLIVLLPEVDWLYIMYPISGTVIGIIIFSIKRIHKNLFQ